MINIASFRVQTFHREGRTRKVRELKIPDYLIILASCTVDKNRPGLTKISEIHRTLELDIEFTKAPAISYPVIAPGGLWSVTTYSTKAPYSTLYYEVKI